MELKRVLETLLRRIRRPRRLRTLALLAVLVFVSTLSLLVWKARSGEPTEAATPQANATPAAASLSGSPGQGPSAGGEVLPANRRLAPQVGQALIRYFEPQRTKPPHVSFVEKAA